MTERNVAARVYVVATVFAFIALAGCGDDSGTARSIDAGVADDGAPDVVRPPVPPPPPSPDPPAAAALPNVLPCPSGWREVAPSDGVGPATCDPRPPGGVPSCAEGEIWVPGISVCETLGGACPSGDWAEDLPGDARVLRVREGADAGGDGSESAPFATIEDALGVARDGDVIAIAKGTYTRATAVRRAVTLWGACASETLLVGGPRVGSDTLASMLVLLRSGVVVRGLTIGGARQGIEVATGVEARIEDVAIAGASVLGLYAYAGARVTGERVVIRDTTPTASGQQGWGIWAEEGATVELRGLASLRNPDTALLATGEGSALVLSDVYVMGTAAGRGTGRGDAISAGTGATLDLSRALVETSSHRGISFSGRGATLRDVVIADTAEEPIETRGWGAAIALADATEVVVERVHASRTFGIGISLHRSVVSLSDIVVTGNESTTPFHTLGAAISVGDASDATIERAWIAGVRGVGVYTWGGSTMRASDVTVRDVRSVEADGSAGRGVEVAGGSTAELDRVLIGASYEVGLDCQGDGTAVIARDVVVEDVAEGECFDAELCARVGGIGIGVYEGASLEVTRFAVARPSLAGVHVARRGSIEASSGAVRETVVGASLDLSAEDTARFRSAVRFEDTEVDVEARELAVPEPIRTIEE